MSRAAFTFPAPGNFRCNWSRACRMAGSAWSNSSRLAAGVQDGGVVAAAEILPNAGQAFPGKLPAKINCHVASGNHRPPPRRSPQIAQAGGRNGGPSRRRCREVWAAWPSRAATKSRGSGGHRSGGLPRGPGTSSCSIAPSSSGTVPANPSARSLRIESAISTSRRFDHRCRIANRVSGPGKASGTHSPAERRLCKAGEKPAISRAQTEAVTTTWPPR